MGPGPRCRDTYFQTQSPMTLAELDEIQDQARKDRLALALSGFRETHAACPPFQLDGPMLAEAFANTSSFEFGLSTGKKN